MKPILLVASGGAVGCLCRYLAGSIAMHRFGGALFPIGTFCINLLGCLLIGIVAGVTERLPAWNTELRLVLITGFLGGFTTFSAFGLETFRLVRDGELMMAMAYSAGSVVLGVLLVGLGLRLTV